MELCRILTSARQIRCSYSQLLWLKRNQAVFHKRLCTQSSMQLLAAKSADVSSLLWKHRFFRTTVTPLYLTCRSLTTGGTGDEDDEWKGADLDDDGEGSHFLREICTIPDAGHHVMVIQPAIKWGPKKSKVTTPELQLSEVCTLVSTLPRWRVVRKRKVPAKQPDSAMIFGSGTFQQLTREIRESEDVSAVVIGTDILSGAQLSELHRRWKVPIFDRYTIVLQIFKDHARTKEAKLQVALAEIPYIRSRLSQINAGDHEGQLGGASLVGGTGETYMTKRRQILQVRENKLKKALQKVKNQRSLLRQNRQRSDIPTVAVVGYTNSGKTTLIKALTGDAEMQPKDQLFATLDVTAHAGRLPNHMTVIFMDTVGFISDIPVTLIDAFAATLEDAVLADLVVHVRDISHPDTVAQKLNVIETLSRMLSREQLSNVIEVCNKADKLAERVADTAGSAILTSAVSGQGLSELQHKIQDSVIKSSGQLEKTFRIPMQGPMLAWLYKESTVREARPDPADPEHLLVDVIITNASYQRFKKVFSSRQKSQA